MVEPFSTAVSVAGLLSLALQTTEYLYKYYTAYRDRDHDLARIADQLGDLLHSLQIIDDVIRTRKTRANEQTILQHIEKSLTHCEDVINELRDETQKFRKEPTSDVKKVIVGAGRRVAYPFRRSTLEKLTEDVDDFRSNLSIALQALQLKEHQNTLNELEEVKHIVKNAQAQNVAAGVRQWLRAPDATVDYNNASNMRHGKTGQWLVQSPVFTGWLQRDNSFVWLYGFAGCGKSVLCSTAIQHTFRHQRAQVGSATAFFFFTFGDESKQDASAVVRALLLQLGGQVTGFEAELVRLQNTYNHGTPPVSTLMEYLRQAISLCHHVYILLDALDESPIETARADVLSMIESMRQWHLPGLHLLVTSRDAPDIRSCLETQRDFSHTEWVPMKNDNIDQDIRDYVSYQVDHDRDLQRWSESQRQQIKDYLSQHAGGVFRWVKCQLDPLKRCPQSAKHLKHCLQTLPQTLDKTYERMLCSIDEESQDDAQRILSLLCYAPRPLSVDEVIEANAVDIDNLERYDPDRKLASAVDLSRICPGLIEISSTGRIDDNSDFESEDEDEDEDTDEGDEEAMNFQLVRIGHFSVQEYLMSDRIRQGRAANFALTGPTQHARISEVCLLYLANEDFLKQALTPGLVQQYPFAPYAARHWHDHYRQSDKQLVQQLSEKITALLTNKHAFERWISFYDADEPWNFRVNYDKAARDHGSLIYYVALLGFDDILQRILSMSSADVNAQGGFYGTALAAASWRGHEQVVQILLDNGADINARVRGFYGTALIAASSRGHEQVVQTLLDNGADVNADGNGYHATALIAASSNGHEKVVQILLDNGADVNTEGQFGTALEAASTEGHEQVVQSLLDNGAGINAEGKYGTALGVASKKGHEQVVRILLENSADVEISRFSW